MYFENRKKSDTYMWLANMQTGPTLKFLVQNVHTMEELKFTGNCLRGSRPFLSFDTEFDEHPWSKLVKEVLSQTFGTPAYHPKSQPFFDHVFAFRILDKRIWFRNYQIVEEDGSLVEIGPRFCLNLVKIFDGPFSGAVIYTNPHYLAPNKARRLAKQDDTYVNRIEQKVSDESISIRKRFSNVVNCSSSSTPTRVVFLPVVESVARAANAFWEFPRHFPGEAPSHRELARCRARRRYFRRKTPKTEGHESGSEGGSENGKKAQTQRNVKQLSDIV